MVDERVRSIVGVKDQARIAYTCSDANHKCKEDLLFLFRGGTCSSSLYVPRSFRGRRTCCYVRVM